MCQRSKYGACEWAVTHARIPDLDDRRLNSLKAPTIRLLIILVIIVYTSHSRSWARGDARARSGWRVTAPGPRYAYNTECRMLMGSAGVRSMPHSHSDPPTLLIQAILSSIMPIEGAC